NDACPILESEASERLAIAGGQEMVGIGEFLHDRSKRVRRLQKLRALQVGLCEKVAVSVSNWPSGSRIRAEHSDHRLEFLLFQGGLGLIKDRFGAAGRFWKSPDKVR